MTLIELLELLVKGRPLNVKQKGDALALLAELKRVNAFGSVTATLHAEHECTPRLVTTTGGYPNRRRTHLVCVTCGRKM